MKLNLNDIRSFRIERDVLKRSFLFGFNTSVFLFLLVFLTGCLSEEIGEKPNIIIIYADDVGYGDLSSYGAEHIQTANIDRLADEGIRFTNAYATSAMCTPSRYSLLTGKYAFRHPSAGILSAEDPLIIEPGSFTVPKMLQEAGYTTGIVGKWHLGLGREGEPINWNGQISPGPLEVGFDESFILPVTNDRVPTVYVDGHRVHNLSESDDPLQVNYPAEGSHDYQEEQFGNNENAAPSVPQPLVGNLPSGQTHPENLRYPADAQHSGTIINGISRIGYMAGGQSAWWDDEQMAAEFVDRSKQFMAQNSETPFFLYMSMHENHVPRIPNLKFEGKSGTSLRGDALLELDWAVGQILAYLEQVDIREETMIIFSSDNGPVFHDGYDDGAIQDHNGHDPSGIFQGGKYTAYEGGTRMPTIISWPGTITEGQVSAALISQVDFLHSLAELVNISLPSDQSFDSENMLPALLGESATGRDHLILQSSDGLAVRKGPWKYIEPGERSGWAYNRHNLAESPLNTEPLTASPYIFQLDEDPGETNDLSGDFPEKVHELQQLLDQVKAR